MIPKEWPRLHKQYQYLLSKLSTSCLLCQGNSNTLLCQACQQDFFTPMREPLCQMCSLPLPHNSRKCGDCLSHTKHFDYTHSAYYYHRPLSQLLIQYKQQQNLLAGQALTQLWLNQSQAIQTHPLPEALLAVPLHWRKRWHRGINPCAFFAQKFSKHLDIPLLHGLQRIKYSEEQKKRKRKQRLAINAKHFRYQGNKPPARVAIIDDVMTSGATANAVAKVLKQAGVETVSVWTLARTVRQ